MYENFKTGLLLGAEHWSLNLLRFEMLSDPLTSQSPDILYKIGYLLAEKLTYDSQAHHTFNRSKSINGKTAMPCHASVSDMEFQAALPLR